MDDWTSILSVERVVELHAEGIRRHGEGSIDPPRQGCLEGGLGNAWSAEVYAERPGMVRGFVFAAYVYVYLESRQCFTNGNKRAAWSAMADVLYGIGVDLGCSEQEAIDVCERITAKEMSADDLLLWLAEHAIELDA